MHPLIVIQTDVWRYDCIAGIGSSEEDGEFIIQIFPMNSAEYIAYYYTSKDELYAAYQKILQQWRGALTGSTME